MTFRLLMPRKILFGPGTFCSLGELAGPLGTRTLLVAGRSALRSSGRLQQAQELLNMANVQTTLFEGVERDPSLETCHRAVQLARRTECDMVIAIGGGSAIDVGKTVAAIATQSFAVHDFFHGLREIEKPALPFIAVPTTAGTGSECTRVAVLTDTQQKVKKGVRHDFMMPLIALVDPELTLTAPPEVTAQSGMDALTQAIECFVSKDANPFSDALAMRAIELLARNLPCAVQEGDRIERREPVALGSLLTAIAFGNAGLGAVHGLAHPIGAHFGAPHGLVCAVLLPHVCEFNLTARPEKFETIACLIGADAASDVPEALRALNHRVGIPDTLKGYGITEASIPQILAGCRSGSMAKNPRAASDEDLTAILRKVM